MLFMIKYGLIPNPFERTLLSMRQKIYTTLGVIAIVALISGASILATANPETQSDPLITRSYLTNIFRPLITADINAARTALDQKFTSQINSVTALLNNNTSPPQSSVFVTKVLKANETLAYKAGSEIMLRSGAAQAGTRGLVNYTNATETALNGSLILNNMYLASQDGVIKATAGSTILIRGAPSTVALASEPLTIDDGSEAPMVPEYPVDTVAPEEPEKPEEPEVPEDPEEPEDPYDPDNTENQEDPVD